jgi:hypothetical protein
MLFEQQWAKSHCSFRFCITEFSAFVNDSEKLVLECRWDVVFLIKTPIFQNYSCFYLYTHEFAFIIYYCNIYVKVLRTILDCCILLLQTSSSNSASHYTISHIYTIYNIHIYTDVQLLPLKCVVNAETGRWTKWNITVTTSVFCVSSVILFCAHHTPLAGMFPCSCWRVEIREMSPWESSSRIRR